jgi:hypothetical protein
MNQKTLRALIREVIKEEEGEVTVTKGPRQSKSKSWTSSISSWLGFGDADQSKEDEELLDEDDDAESVPADMSGGPSPDLGISESEQEEYDE